MPKKTGRRVFAGIRPNDSPEAPEWFVDEYVKESVDQYRENIPSLSEVIRDLPRAEKTEAGFLNPIDEEWESTERHNAIIDPDKLKRFQNGENVDPLWHIPTDNYSIINPKEAYEPLCREAESRGIGYSAFGEVREYRRGGEVHMDIMFTEHEVDIENDPIAVGFTTGYDFFGDTALYVTGYAQDSACVNSIRELTEKEVKKHVGDLDDLQTWWSGHLDAVQGITDDLTQMIIEASETEVDFTELPFDVEGFYMLMGLPKYISDAAASDALSGVSEWDMDMWSLHSGATYALAHEFQGRDGQTLEQYHRMANDILFNPAEVLEQIKGEFSKRVERQKKAQEMTQGDDEVDESIMPDNDPVGEGGYDSQGLAQIESVMEESVESKKEVFEDREEKIAARLHQ